MLPSERKRRDDILVPSRPLADFRSRLGPESCRPAAPGRPTRRGAGGAPAASAAGSAGAHMPSAAGEPSGHDGPIRVGPGPGRPVAFHFTAAGRRRGGSPGPPDEPADQHSPGPGRIGCQLGTERCGVASTGGSRHGSAGRRRCSPAPRPPGRAGRGFGQDGPQTNGVTAARRPGGVTAAARRPGGAAESTPRTPFRLQKHHPSPPSFPFPFTCRCG